jgi:F-type H+-transporting ATPase subunit delta
MNTGTAAHLADTYARSVLDLAKESGIVETVATDLEVMATLLKQQPALADFLASPYFAEQTKRGVIRGTFAGKLDRLTVNFLCVLIDHNRGALLPQVLGRFQQMFRAYQGYEAVSVTVAQALAPEQVEKLARDLAEAMRAKIDLEVRVDPAILGGIIIRHGDQMLDNSLRGRLTRTVRQVANPENRHKQQLMKDN